MNRGVYGIPREDDPLAWIRVKHANRHQGANQSMGEPRRQVEALLAIDLALLMVDFQLERIADALERLSPAPSPTLGLTATLERKVTHMQLAPLAAADTQNVQLAADPRDSQGQPTSPTLTWTSSDPTVVTLTPAADGKSALGVVNKIGVTTLSVTDGANTDSVDVTVAVGGTATLGLTATLVAK